MWRCDEIAFLLEDPNIIQKSFPVCVNATRPKRTFVPVHASIHQEPINFGATYRVTFGKRAVGLSDKRCSFDIWICNRHGSVASYLDTLSGNGAIRKLPQCDDLICTQQ
jgi:hypothetical protein